MVTLFVWLKQNDFYDVSPILGLDLINRAKTYIEKLLWYVAIIVFMSFTIYNIQIAVKYYWSAPAVTDVHVASSTANSTFTNFTIKLQLPISELDQTGFDNLLVVDIYQVYFDPEILAMGYNADYVEEILANFPKVWCHSIYDDQLTNELQRKTQSVLQLIKQFNSPKTLSLPSGTLSWPCYLKQMETFKTLLKNELTKPLPSGGEIVEQHFLQEQLNSFKVIANSIQSSWDNLTEALSILKSSSKEHFHSISDLVQAVHNWPVIRIQSNVGTVHMRNWTIDSAMQTYDFHATVPYGTRDIKLALYSNQMTRLFTYLTVFNEHLKTLLQKSIDQPENTGYTLCLMNWTPNVTTTLMEQLNKHYGKAGMYLEMESGSIHVKPFTNNTISMRPIAHLQSAVKNCSRYNMQTCIDQCQLKYFIDQCGCVPWNLFFINQQQNEICHTECSEPNIECGVRCETWLEHSCDSTMYSIELEHDELNAIQTNRVLRNDSLFDHGAESALTIEPNTPLIAIQMRIPEVSIHAVYHERYSMNFGNLMAQIGGHFEFFLGINLVVLIHLIVYIIQSLYSSTANETYMLQRINELRERLDHIAMKLKNPTKQKTLQKRLKNVLRRNDWYTTTPFTGWQFINDARSGRVATFWALLLMIFFCLTIQAVASSLQIYTSKPIKTMVTMASRDRNSQFENVTIVMEISLFEFLITDMNRTVDIDTLTEMHPTRCITTTSKSDEFHTSDFWFMNINGYLYELIRDISESQENLDRFWKGINLNRNYWESYEMWYQNMSIPLKEMLDSFVASMAEDFGVFIHDFDKLFEIEMEIHEYIIKSMVQLRQHDQYLWRNSLLALHLMESFELGVDPRWKANNDYLIENAAPNPFDKYAEAREIFDKFAINPAKLLRAVLKYFTPQIYSPNAQVHFVDSKTNFNKYTQQLIFKLIPNENSDGLSFQVHYYSLSRHLIIWQAIADYMADRMDTNEPTDCSTENGIQGLGTHFLYQYMFMHSLKEIVSHTKLNDMIKIELPSGHINLHPFTSSQINLVPTATYISQTESCYKGTLDGCVSDCMVELHVSECDCVPWHLIHLSNKPLCQTPCKTLGKFAREICIESCQKHISNICKTTTYRAEKTNERQIKHYGWDGRNDRFVVYPQKPIYSVDIKKTELHTHPVFMQNYEISLGNLIANMGALLELWLGINIMGVIHLVVYIAGHLMNGYLY